MNVRVNLLAIFVLSICSTCAHAQFDTVINLPDNPDSANPSGFSGNSIGSSSGISSNTQLNVSDNGSIGSFFNAGASDVLNTNIEVNILGGTVGQRFSANSGSTINISGGTVETDFDANSGSTVNISGGSIVSAGFSSSFRARGGSTVNITGGTIAEDFNALSGSTVNISGGAIDRDFDALSGSTVNVSGGAISQDFNALSGSTVNILGGEFLLNGNAISDTTAPFTLGTNDTLTGTLVDGSSFIFSTESRDSLNGVNLVTETITAAVNTAPQTINTASTLRSLRAGQTLTVQTGGELVENLNAVGATINIEAGSIGDNLRAASSEINVSGGVIGRDFDALSGSTVNISGGANWSII